MLKGYFHLESCPVFTSELHFSLSVLMQWPLIQEMQRNPSTIPHRALSRHLLVRQEKEAVAEAPIVLGHSSQDGAGDMQTAERTSWRWKVPGHWHCGLKNLPSQLLVKVQIRLCEHVTGDRFLYPMMLYHSCHNGMVYSLSRAACQLWIQAQLHTFSLGVPEKFPELV
jgi:hypothetical protein